MSRLVVVKVGGSLYDLPDLGIRLLRFLSEMDAERITIVPGGGMTADAIRRFDAVHRLGEEQSHWLALRTLTVNAHFLARLLPEFIVSDDWRKRRVLLDAYAFAVADERRAHPMSHVWNATSDCVAAQLALRGEADELILLKSRPWNGHDWARASQEGIVDAVFPTFAAKLNETKIRVVDLRSVPN